MAQKNLKKIVLFDSRGILRQHGISPEKLKTLDARLYRIQVDELQEVVGPWFPHEETEMIGVPDSAFSAIDFVWEYDGVVWVPVPADIIQFYGLVGRRGANWFEQLQREGYHAKRVLVQSEGFRLPGYQALAKQLGLDYSTFADKILTLPSKSFEADLAEAIKELYNLTIQN